MAERALAARLADAAGQRAFGRRGEARQPGIWITGDDARSEDEQVGRIEGVDTTRAVAQQVVRGEQSAAAVDAPEIGGRLLDPRGALRQIDMEHLAMIAERLHVCPFP